MGSREHRGDFGGSVGSKFLLLAAQNTWKDGSHSFFTFVGGIPEDAFPYRASLP